MTRTLHRIELPSGVTLLEIGDTVEEELAPAFSQGAARFGAIGARWGMGKPLGNVEFKLEWTRVKNYVTNTEARLAMMMEPAMVGIWESTTADITLPEVSGSHDPFVIRVFDFVLEAMVPRQMVCATGGRILWKYSARGGQALPVSGVREMPGTPSAWSLAQSQNQLWVMNVGYAVPTSAPTNPFSPSDPGDFEAAAFSPSDPGDFEATAFSPSDPGSFPAAAFSPSDPGNG